MARPLRIEFPWALYHVTARVNARQDSFMDDEDRQQFLAVLAWYLMFYNQVRAASRVEGTHTGGPL